MERLKVMGILNTTPDSFSDGGKYNSVEAAVKRALEMVEEGADIIDVGGYSTRPGYTEITAEEEIERTAPVVKALREAGITADISVDTFRSDVARAVLEAGATMINDQWRGIYDEKILDVVAEFDVPIFLMHNNDHSTYKNVTEDMIRELKESAELALKHGVKKENIWLDPGIGFVKSREEEIEVMQNLDRLTAEGYPVLLATSRKRMVKELIGGETNADDRDAGTLATTIIGIDAGVKAVRVHNVKMNRQAADVYMKLKGDYNG
ncbi:MULTISPECIES: dihydropteroate synthase [Jeotgalicoccus]|uniref:Dihydropteroate synthase n=1 Tax=Jeotgalicoccus nanhaiensis TaxID=568603 RepID=A0ABR9Y055_9STAP|nr:dihydropteroate synthase [Jeotgalicoccus nanhaiensis]MBF0754618.1 dihydropteroate synthase [Jeotgalicoccus nanhaiensis]TFU60965.1 dihydropteroate synthase [Jeotgalicoccus nanhaiensis]